MSAPVWVTEEAIRRASYAAIAWAVAWLLSTVLSTAIIQSQQTERTKFEHGYEQAREPYSTSQVWKKAKP